LYIKDITLALLALCYCFLSPGWIISSQCIIRFVPSYWKEIRICKCEKYVQIALLGGGSLTDIITGSSEDRPAIVILNGFDPRPGSKDDDEEEEEEEEEE
jgi:hypothetical protein